MSTACRTRATGFRCRRRDAHAMRTPDELPFVPGFTRGEIHRYEVPEFGWSVPYHGQEFTATVFVYPGRNTTGEPSERLAEELSAAVDELIEHGASRGVEVVVLDQSPGRIDATQLDRSARSASFLLRGSHASGQSSTFNEVILAIAGDEFLKVRCTYTPEKPKRSGSQINRLLAGLKSML
jgi:hypothetical protein